jgi:sugar phosphate isomerase/epimerase
MRKVGYDGVISIEHEDPRYSGEEGTTRSLESLRRILKRVEASA